MSLKPNLTRDDIILAAHSAAHAFRHSLYAANGQCALALCVALHALDGEPVQNIEANHRKDLMQLQFQLGQACFVFSKALACEAVQNLVGMRAEAAVAFHALKHARENLSEKKS